MTIPFACILAAFVLIWVPRAVVAGEQAKQPEGYDNRNPREQQARLSGRGKRAQAAHNNTFESFAPFAAAVFVAHLGHANERWSTILACTFVAARVVYPFLYIADIDKGRSAVWFVGLLATVGLFVLPMLS
jgi:uncharacterized MAPEG superfamily protein